MKIVVGMSGGVDSTIAAYMLKKMGHEVIGAHFDFLKDCEDKENDIYEIPDNLKKISESLNIPIIHKNFAKEFRDKVIKSFVLDYENGITPNPCALCNGIMKFEKLLCVMKEENADMIATGHYANVENFDVVYRANDGVKEKIVKRYCIKKSKNLQKDQSYMLYRLSQDQLSHIIFPIGDMDKNEVREVARELNLEVANAKDSQDVCFISDEIDYKEFIKRYEFGDDYREKIARGKLTEEDIRKKPYFKKGEFVDINGKVLGYHDGIINYTIGQRKGLNIAFGERKFVVRIDVEKNQVVLGSNDDLMQKEFTITDNVFSGIGIYDENDIHTMLDGRELFAKLRYRHDGTICSLKEFINIGKLKFSLSENVRAITKGQAAVFYDDEGRIMFGGRII